MVSKISWNNFRFFEFRTEIFSSSGNFSDLFMVEFNSAYLLKKIIFNKNHTKSNISYLNKFPTISIKPQNTFPRIRKNIKVLIVLIFSFSRLRKKIRAIWFIILIRAFIKKINNKCYSSIVYARKRQFLKTTWKPRKRVCFSVLIQIYFEWYLNVYRQLGDSNSQWHKKNLQEGPVGGSASWGNSSWGKCQLEDKNLTFGRAIFLQFWRR